MSKVRLFGHSLLWMFTVSITVLAVVLIVARFFITQVPDYKLDLEAYLSEEMGGNVSIGQMTARLDGFSPQLSLKKVTLGELAKQTKTLRIGEIRLSLNPWGVVLGDISPSTIAIFDTHVEIKRFADGHVSIEGFSTETNDDSSSGDFSWLLENGAFELVRSEIVWKDEMRGEDDITLNNAHIIFQNSNQQHKLKITAQLPSSMGGQFELALHVKGDVLTTNNWSAEGYLKTQKINLADILLRLDIEQFKLPQGGGDIELWSSWENADLARVRGHVLVNEARLISAEKKLNIEKISSQFDWQKQAYGWNVQVKDFSFTANGVVQEKSQFSLDYALLENQDRLVNVTASWVDLTAFSTVIEYLDILEEDHQSTLSRLNLKGNIRDSYLSLTTVAGHTSWAGCGTLQGYSNDAIDKMPGIGNFSGTGCSSNKEGWADIETTKGFVAFKTLFRDPLLVDGLNGRFRWLQGENGWGVVANSIQLESPHIATTTRLNIFLPNDSAPVFMDLQTNFGIGNAQFTSKYLPVGIMGKDVVKWLDNAFKNGQTTGGSVLLRGALQEFPFRNNRGLFQVLFATENIDLHYAKGWPDVVGVSANVEFKNQGMNISSQKGSISGNKIEHALVTVDDLKSNHYLTISGEINDEIKGLYQFFRQSPLKQSISGLLDNSVVAGQAKVNLNLQIPLRKKLEAKVNVQAKLMNNTLSFPDIDIAVSQIKGDVFYGKGGLNAKSLSAKVLGHTTRVDIVQEQNNTTITGVGRLDTNVLSKKFSADIWKSISGESAATLTVKVPRTGLSAKGAVTIALESDLAGISVAYPEPIGKQKNAPVAFKASTQIGGALLPVNASYGSRLQAVMLFDGLANKKLALSKANIHLGASVASLPPLAGVKLTGQIAELNIPAWEQALDLSGQNKSNKEIINQVDLKINKLVLRDMMFSNIQLSGEHQKGIWQGLVESPKMTGAYKVPSNFSAGGLVTLKLDSLTLPEVSSKQLKEQETLAFEPTDFPNINVTSKRLFFGKTDLGSFAMKLRRKSNGLIIQQLDLNSKRDEFSAKGAWEKNKNNSNTGLVGRLKSKSLGALLKDVEVLSDLEGASSGIYFDLNWPGPPHEFTKKTLNGFATVKSEKGRLLNVEPGLGRVFGLLGLDTLKRRLQLDFSDLVSKGLGFDKIKGRFIVVNGDARTSNLYLESPSSRLDIVGRVGLGKEDYDQLITVTPKSTESLPVAGAIAGGPLLGAAIYIVQKVAGKRVNKLAGYQYHVTGSWSDPKIEQLSRPGGKVFGIVGDIFSPVFGVILGSDSGNEVEPQAPVK